MTMQFKDHPYPPGTPENIRHEEIARYMHSYAAQFDLSEKISFETRVESAEKVGDEWKLVVRRVSEVPHGLEEIFSTEVGHGHLYGSNELTLDHRCSTLLLSRLDTTTRRISRPSQVSRRGLLHTPTASCIPRTIGHLPATREE